MTMQLVYKKDIAEKPEIVTKGDVAYQALEQSRLSDLPYVVAQEELEVMFDKCQQVPRIRKELDIPAFTEIYEAALADGMSPEIQKDFCIDLCIQMCIHKRTTASTLVAILYHHFDTGLSQRMVAMQSTADALEQCIEYDFVDYSRQREEFIVRLELTRETQLEIDRYQYPLPMVVQPKRITKNTQNGYLSRETSNSLVVLKTGASSSFYREADLCLGHLNKMNSISLTINQSVVDLIDNEWSDLDVRRPKETQADYDKRVKAFKRYDASSKDVIAALTQMRDRFWLTHKYDRRGRVYCQGYHVNYQGNPWNKAVVEFANKEFLDE